MIAASRFRTALVVVLAATAAPASAQTAAENDGISLPANEPHREYKAGKVLRAMRVQAPPLVDGRLNDEVWSRADAASDFVQRDPDNGEPMTQGNKVQVAYDDQYLYVAVTNLDNDAAAIAAGLGRRDETPPTDHMTIGFDTRHDHQTAYNFSTNPSGWQGDFTFSDDTRRDSDYNAVWEVRTEINGEGWTAEFRIPFSQMRFASSTDASQIWGFGVQRQVRRNSETGTWVAKPRGESGEVSFFGHLVFDEPLPSPSRLEISPYLAARSEHGPRLSAERGLAGGVDMRVGVGTGATLSATVNPDFGQVEQDPAVLNLSVFETFFPEKRAFFLEDSRTFVPPYGLFQLFHSRRIGRAPGRLALATGDVSVDKPDDTTILGAAKLTGKSAGWTYGVLTAATGREYSVVDSPFAAADGSSGTVRSDKLIEPATSYNVVRVQRDVRGASNIGAIATAVMREKLEDAFTGGFDYNLRWDDNRTRLEGHWVVTHAPGTGGMKTSGGGVMNFNRSRKHVNVGLHYDHFGRDFRVNDIGFFRSRANRNRADGFVEVGQPDPGKVFRSLWWFLSAGQAWTDERLLIERGVETGVAFSWLNFWRNNIGFGGNGDTYDDLDTRGGPPILRRGERYFFTNVNSDSRKSWRVNFGASGGRTGSGTTFRNVFGNISIQPSDRIQASVAGRYNYGHEVAQWIASQDTTQDGVTDYVYGQLNRNVVDLTFRATYAFHRDLTVQAYLQPFVAVGDYQDIKRLVRPKSFDFEPTTLPFDPDFNNKSLRGNVVMRWEYVRGSTLFVVWDMSQADATRPGVFSPLRDLRSAFGADATHVLMVKATYWMNR
jgi:hypothetical protein